MDSDFCAVIFGGGCEYLCFGLFTALCNGLVSAGISFARTIVFEAGAVLLLPIAFDLNGVWMALPVAEGLALLVSVGCLIFSGSAISTHKCGVKKKPFPEGGKRPSGMLSAYRRGVF